MDNTTEKKLDSILGAIQNLRNDLTKQINEETNKLQSKLDKISDKQHEIEDKQYLLEGKIKHIERTLKRKNIVIYNIEEVETGNLSLQECILHFFNNIMGIETNTNELDFVRRIGKKGERTRPILVGLTTQIKKDIIMKNKSKLKQFKDAIIYIRDDQIKEDINSERKENEKKQNIDRQQPKDTNINTSAPTNSKKRTLKTVLPLNDIQRSEPETSKKQKRFETQKIDDIPQKTRIDQFFKTYLNKNPNETQTIHQNDK